MIIITLKDLIYIVPDLISLFLSGFIFILMYNWLNNKKSDNSSIIILSLVISVLIRSFYSTIHKFILNETLFDDSEKIIVYSLTGVFLAFVITYLRNTKIIRAILFKVNNKTINDDIFNDIIDYKKITTMHIYLKSSDECYCGRYLIREENGMDSWISLIDYYKKNKTTNNIVFDPRKSGIKSTVTINFKDIERIELFYQDDSETWKYLKNDE